MTTADRALLPVDDEARLAAVRRYNILDTPPDGAFDRITALAARLFRVPIAIVSVVDHDRIWFKSRHGLDIDEVERTPGLCASAILQTDTWVVSDAPRDPRALANPLVAGDFGLKFYAGVPLRTPDGHNLGTLCILDFQPKELTPSETATLEDLAAIVMGELELRLASGRAVVEGQEREQLKDAVLGMLSHELRTPATTIYAAATILAQSDAVRNDARARDLLPDIAAESERLVTLIENLLLLTRLEESRLEAGREPILIQHVLPKAIAREARRWPDRRILFHGEPGLPPATGDQVYVEQVVLNLLSNALKYSTSESAVDVYASVADDRLEVRVRDRGIGIDIGSRETVFELLTRTDAARSFAPGAGIGLYLCRRLIEAMGGRIWIDAPPDGGTVIAFHLPVALG